MHIIYHCVSECSILNTAELIDLTLLIISKEMYKILFIIGVAAIHINAQTYNCPYSYSGTDACKLCYPNCKQFCEDHNICCHQHWTGVFDPQLGLNEGYGYELVPRKPKSKDNDCFIYIL